MIRHAPAAVPLLLAAVLAGCGSSDASVGATGTPSTTTAADTGELAAFAAEFAQAYPELAEGRSTDDIVEDARALCSDLAGGDVSTMSVVSRFRNGATEPDAATALAIARMLEASCPA